MRLFVAIEISDVLRNSVELRIESTRARLPAASWLRPDALHLTLAFLGEQSDESVETIAGALAVAASTPASFSVHPAGAGFFPHHRAPRVAWITLEPAAPLVALAQSVRKELERAGVGFDGKGFVPHLTICRIRSRWRQEDADAFTQTFSDIDTPPFEVHEVVLFRSELRQEGAVHTPLHRVSLVRRA
ncbi:MAG TPA: RNA 2',3'-cyclic phosphodiesterase [Thermoanaerobaculia bacterium]|nr:RNA 2',3'-cyclic phosphodiesterase [Thermoanaerobaculia bacterium]